ncbi:MAG: sugar transferase [Erysipelotrichales bacterium]|nr:sugar transferase [Erysipelotrichales bacterium]
MNSAELVADTISIKKQPYLVVKRILDIVISLFGLIVFSPVLLIVAIAIKLESKGPILYAHDRIGQYGKLFRFYKFRSMVYDADDILYNKLLKDEEMAEEYKINKKLNRDPRITKVGRFLRKTSMDELPQLWNVLKGDMSLVGNRPYMPREKEDMGEYFNDIVKTKPGLTGYWQVSGRSNKSFKKRLKLEQEYSNIYSFKLDVKIFFKTFFVVFNHDGGAK